MKIKDVAQFMLKELTRNGILYQEKLVPTIKEKFGEQFLFTTTHGTLTIDRKVLREFNKIKGKDIYWDKEESCWR